MAVWAVGLDLNDTFENDGGRFGEVDRLNGAAEAVPLLIEVFFYF